VELAEHQRSIRSENAGKQAVGMNGLSGWALRPSQLSMPRDQVHVWRIQSTREEFDKSDFRKLLNHSELLRADRFRFEEDRWQFTVVRGFLRHLLSSYLQVPVTEIDFAYNESGKPSLAIHLNKYGLQFSVAHSHEYGLVALSCDVQIGIDLEFERSGVEYLQLAETLLSDVQFAEFMKVPPDVQGACFYRFWTRKEAVAKAIGIGLSMPFQSFDVSFQPDESPGIIQLDSLWGPADKWSLHDLDVASGFAAALAVHCRGRSVHLFDGASAGDKPPRV